MSSVRVVELECEQNSYYYCSKEYVDADTAIAGPSGLRRESAGSDRGSESESESSSSSDEGSEYNGSEDEREHVQLQPAENEIEGDFECVCSLSISSVPNAPSYFLVSSRLISSIRKSDGQKGGGVLSQAWDLSVDDEDDWRDELREASGVGRRRKKGVRISWPFHCGRLNR